MKLPRLTFLARFTIVIVLLALFLGGALPYVLANAHLRAIQEDEAVTAAGEISALMTVPLEAYVRAKPAQRQGPYLAMAQAASAGQRFPIVSSVRVYAPDGRAIYPRGSAPEPAAALRAHLDDGLWTKAGTLADGTPVRIEYAPFADNGVIVAVIAIDMPLVQMAHQERGERAFVTTITVAVMAVIFLSLFTLALGASRELERRRREAENTFAATLGTLAETLELRDPYTAGHSRRVADYSRTLATALGCDKREVEIIANAALVHDIGKIGIPDAVLLKAGRLDETERDIIGKHPSLGAAILSSVSAMKDVVPCVLHHHERVDGNGYPDHLGGDDIPHGARIIAVTDSFDAMTTDRPYRRALSSAAAIAELRRVAGLQLDPTIVEAFVTLVEAGAAVPPPPAQHENELIGRFGPQVVILRGATP